MTSSRYLWMSTRSFLACLDWDQKTHPNFRSFILWAGVLAYTFQWPLIIFRIKSNFLSRLSVDQMTCLHLPCREYPVCHPELTNSLSLVFELLLNGIKTHIDHRIQTFCSLFLDALPWDPQRPLVSKRPWFPCGNGPASILQAFPSILHHLLPELRTAAVNAAHKEQWRK